MSIFDSVKHSGGGLIGSDVHAALVGALAKSPLGDVSGLLDRLHERGLDSAVDAWSIGEDHPHVGPGQLREALGDQHVQQLADSMGVSTDQLLTGLSEHLPALAAHNAGDDADHEDDEDHDGDNETGHGASGQAGADDADAVHSQTSNSRADESEAEDAHDEESADA